MPATQLLLDFTVLPTLKAKPVPADSAWHNVTDFARCAGFQCTCGEISMELHDQLGDQALYDALWTACFTLSLNRADIALFTLELDGTPIRFKAHQTNHAVRLGRVNDF
jgi:hypothetical protein